MKPYYIVTFDWTIRSAGICWLHTLCHELNLRGCEAYVAPHIVERNPKLNTPVIFSDEYLLEGIIIYPEVFSYPLPFETKTIVRWLLCFPGKLGGPEIFNGNELIFSGFKSLLPGLRDDQILEMNLYNKEIFYPSDKPREGSCYWVGRNKCPDISQLPKDCIKIPREFDQREVGHIFRSTKVFYCFDATALSHEAAMCGCKVKLIHNKYFDKDIEELSRRSINREEFLKQLDNFIQVTQRGYFK